MIIEDNNGSRELYSIEVYDNFTPKIFYEWYLTKLQKYFVENQGEETSKRLFVDLSKCSAIDGSVIPNLLVTGYIIKNNTGFTPILYLPDSNTSNIGNFLKQINFLDINDDREIYDVLSRFREKNIQYKLPEYCTTAYLDDDLKEEQVYEILQRQYGEFFNLRYLESFVYVVNPLTEKQYFVNILEIFCKQVCFNAIDHGESFCVITIQVNQKLQKIFISIADCGKGMYRGLEEQIQKGYNPVLLPCESEMRSCLSRYKKDLLSIIEGIVYRYEEEDYGLWNVLKDVLGVHGVMRFHSGKARVILDYDMEEVMRYRGKKEVAKGIYEKSQKNNNKEMPYYAGTHVEIELPLKI